MQLATIIRVTIQDENGVEASSSLRMTGDSESISQATTGVDANRLFWEAMKRYRAAQEAFEKITEPEQGEP